MFSQNIRATSLFLAIASLAAGTSHAFVTPSQIAISSSKSPFTPLQAAAVDDNNVGSGFIVRPVDGGEDDPTVVDIAAYRNNLVNPQMMVDRAQKKRDSIDTTKAAIDGLKVGLLYVGPIIGIGSYFAAEGQNALPHALENYGEIFFVAVDFPKCSPYSMKLILSHCLRNRSFWWISWRHVGCE